jgi:sugar/nucleoside kinase (ribokinase family)
MLFQGGGPCSTALVAVAKLGVAATYLGTVGDDLSGNFIREDLQRYGVDVDSVKVLKGFTSAAAFVLSNKEKGTRTCIWAKGSLPPLCWDSWMEPILDQAEILHLDGNHLDAAIPAARYIHERGKLVSLDAGGLYPGIETLLAHIDILVPSEEFALNYTKTTSAEDAIAELYEAFHPKHLVITQGKNGGVFFDQEKKKIVRYPALPATVIDSNGAGDVFHGAFLVATLKGLPIYESCLFASAVSALKCTVFGARQGVPSFNDTLKYLKANGITLPL